MSIASKNLYELLGNDPELDPERAEPVPPTKAIDKPIARAGKRNGPAEAPSQSNASTSQRSAPRDSRNANDNAFRDRGLGADKNRSRGSGDAPEGGYRGGRGGRGRGGRGGRGGGGAATGDRHSRTGINDGEKQAAHGWGGNDGNAELADEEAGEAIAKEEEKDAAVATGEDATAPEAEPEPEDKTKSYAAYLAEKAERALALGSTSARKANEGSSKKFPEGTAISREEEEDFIAGGAGKAKRERQRKEKNVVELDGDRMLQQAPRENFRGRGRGRGEGRGGEGRGGGRGEYRGGEGRGRGGRGRGEGGRGGGEGRGRGGRGGSQSGPNIADSSAFPSLGS